MSTPPKRNNADSDVSSTKRRSVRLPVMIPTLLRGTDISGQPFEEKTWTISVNKQGAQLVTFHQLSVSNEITLENPILGRSARALVIRVNKKKYPEDPFEVMVELLETQDVWGVKFQPEDWQRDGLAPADTGDPRTTSKKELAARAATPAVTAAPVPPHGTPIAPAQSPADRNDIILEKFDQYIPTVPENARLAQDAKEKTEIPKEETVKHPVQAYSELVRNFQEAVSRLEEKEKAVQSAEQRLNALADSFAAPRIEIETLLSKFWEIRQLCQTEVEKTKSDIKQACLMAGLPAAVTQNALRFIEQSLQENRKQFGAEMAGAAARTQDMFEQALLQRKEATLSSLNQAVDEAKTGIATAFGEIEHKLLALGGQREKEAQALFNDLERQTASLLESSARQLQSQADETLEMVRELLQERAKQLAEESEKRTASVVQVALDSFTQQAEAGAEGYRRQHGAMLLEFQRQSEQLASSIRQLFVQTEEKLSATAQATVETVATLAKSAAQGLQPLSEQLTTSATTLIEETEKRSAALVQSALDGLLREAQEREAIAAQLTASTKSLVNETEKQLAAAADASLESLRKEAQATVEDCRRELPKLVLEIRDQSCREQEAHFSAFLEQQRGTLLAQVRKESEDSGQRALVELRAQFAQAAGEASNAVDKQVGLGAIVLKDWADQASARLERDFQQSVDAFQKQISEASRVIQEKHHQESAHLLESVHNLLNEAARLFRQKPGE